ncbi:RNase H [Carex littledalei]|uniref:RNase H n=1 Tax=Carex littledalei TaxID=544730 RepID=A0A833RXN4_9POAL|nr:RNase H [Carex littledalei]
MKEKNTTPQAILAQAQALSCTGLVSHNIPPRECIEPVLVPRGNMVILMDASWDSTKKTGTAFVLFDEMGRLQYVHTAHIECSDPLQAEATALLQVLNYVKGEVTANSDSKVLVCTDCKVLVNSILQRTVLDLPSWRAAEVVAEGAQLHDTMIGRITLRHVNRKMIPQPHLLANWARTSGYTCSGSVPAHIALHANLNPEIDRDKFKLVQL